MNHLEPDAIAKVRPWDEYVSQADLEVFRQAGYGGRQGLGNRPAVLVVDVTVGMIGDHPEPVLESNRKWPDSCGDYGWSAAEHISTLLEVARTAEIPVIYFHPAEPGDAGVGAAVGAGKHTRWSDDGRRGEANEVAPLVRPQAGDLVIEKPKPSGFFGTHLISILNDLGIDSVIVCGSTTSGCVRATVVDAASYNYTVAVVEEATFDRVPLVHAISLFDIDQKYADVISVDEVISHLQAVGQ